MKLLHYPVMNKEVLEVLGDPGDSYFVDCTLGMGGHSHFVLERFERSRVLGMDVDNESIQKARANLAPYGDRVEILRCDYVNLFETVDIKSYQVAGLLIDPGISMVQLKDPDRGFSHNIDAPLDMRKDQTTGINAADVVNTMPAKELVGIFREFGEVKQAEKLVQSIIERRLFQKIDTTFQLKEVVEKVYGKRVPKGKVHPAALVFQALRIYVNGELSGIDEFLRKAASNLNAGAKIIFLSFHSVEDRMAKRTFKGLSQEGLVKIVKPFPMFPSEEEIQENSPSRPAKLRAVIVQ